MKKNIRAFTESIMLRNCCYILLNFIFFNFFFLINEEDWSLHGASCFSEPPLAKPRQKFDSKEEWFRH